MSTPQTNYSQQQPQPAKGIPLWVGAVVVGIVVLAGGTFLGMQFFKPVPKSPITTGISGRPTPGAPGAGTMPTGGMPPGAPGGGAPAGPGGDTSKTAPTKAP